MSDVRNAIDVSGRVAIAAIDFHRTRVFAIDSGDHTRPETIKANDPKGFFHNVYHRHGNHDGVYEDDSDVYWKTIAGALRPADAILVLGHGEGKANAGHHFIAYAEHHDAELAQRILGEYRVDVDSLTDEQILRMGQHMWGVDPARWQPV